MEDVWITLSEGQIPHWMEDQAMCDGIHAMLKCDCCLEEQCQLGLKADNLCQWYGVELAAVELAVCTLDSEFCVDWFPASYS